MAIRKKMFTRFALTVAASALLSIPAMAMAKDIKNFNDLCDIANDLKGDYVLVNDITITSDDLKRFNGSGFKPIGTERAPFTGKFRGKDNKTYVIRGLYIDRPTEPDVGLFGFVGRGAEISHVGVVTDNRDNIGIRGDFSVGVLAGTNNGNIESCYAAGFVEAVGRSQAESSAGGLVGFNGGRIERSFSSANVTGKQYVGGLVGFLTIDPSGRIIESYATGEVTGTTNVGGLVGYIFDGAVEKCFSTVKAVGIGERGVVGGLVGGDFNSLNASWNVRGKNGAGGYVKGADIQNSYWDKDAFGVPSTFDIRGAVGITSDEMADPNTFKNWDGFDSTWNIADGARNPQFRAEAAALCTLGYKAGFNGTLRVGGAYVPADSVFVVILEEGSKTPEVMAIADGNYTFDNWTDGKKSSARVDTASVSSGKKEVTALFSRRTSAATSKLTYMVEEGQEACGALRVNIKGDTIETPKYSVTLVKGAAGFEVRAVAAGGCAFRGWDDCAAGDACESDTVRVDKSDKDSVIFTALFVRTVAGPEKPDSSSLLYTSGAGGELRRSRGTAPLWYDYGGALKIGTRGPLIAAVPDAGYRFDRWNDGGETLLRSDTAKNYDATFVAVFKEAAGNPIEIVALADLQKIGTDPAYPPGGNYTVKNNIDAAGAEFTPLGSKDKPFTGVFDGGNYKISGLSIDNSGGDFTGLFGYAENARISRVLLTGASVVGGNNTGALVGRSVNTLIDSCGVDGGTVEGADSAGGLVGSAITSLISRSYSTAVVVGEGGGGGGLVGAATGSMITHSYAVGKVEGGEGVGGLAGLADAGIVQYSYATGSVSGTGAVGGFVGAVSGGAEFYQCYSAGYVEGGEGGNTGGFAGSWSGGGAAESCYWDKEISEQEASAGGSGVTGANTNVMMYNTTYRSGQWDFEKVWNIKGGESYPYLRELEPTPPPGMGMSKSRRASLRQAEKRLINVRGRTLTLNAPRDAVWLVRLIDMRGRTVARYNPRSGNKISLHKIPSGKYVIEMRDRGRRVDVRGVVLR